LKILFCYFSTTGNTKLAGQYIASKIPDAVFDFLDIAREPLPDLESYGLVGFAAFADFLGPSKLVMDFIKQIPHLNGKPAFVFNTYGNINGATLRILKRQVQAQGFQVLAGFALNTPENFPPLIAGGLTNADRPKEGQMEEFNRFIVDLGRIVSDLREGEPREFNIKFGLFDRLMPPMPRTIDRKLMGVKMVDRSLCNKCGLCRKGCPYRAIELNPEPVFDQKKCYGCWSCYNHCPTGAIYTKKMRNAGRYPHPNEELRKKLGKENTV
jgi:ferredoxin/flavodoxin